ncbi:MAG: arylamine N-acetyltransferase [Solirubrobacteraceae bacterium]
MFDLDAYLERIGLDGRPSIAQVHRAHLTSIPFENLDPHRGLPVSLAVEDLERKLVTERRGGYCFEQNLLLKAALEALGAEVDMLLARVRLGAEPGVVRPRSHLFLRVSGDGAGWHADVGFPRGILEPIPFGPGPTQKQSGWSFRVVEEDSELVLQKLAGDEWADVCGFLPQPVPLIDVETSNWWTSTHPRSLFVTGLIVGVRGDDGTGALLCDWSELSLSEQTPAGTSVTPLEREAIPELLATRFSLPGFTLAADGRLVLINAG